MSHLIQHGFVLTKQGAEAKIYEGTYLGRPAVVKERFSKKYRDPDLDAMLRKQRTKAEARLILEAMSNGVRVPKLYYVDYDNGTIYMEHISGVTIKEHLLRIFRKMRGKASESDDEWIKKVCPTTFLKNIGTSLANLHFNYVIHGDVTVTNMLLHEIKEQHPPFNTRYEVVMVDFGLASISNRVKDMAMDLMIFEKSFTSIHIDLTYLFTKMLAYYDFGNEEETIVFDKYNKLRERNGKIPLYKLRQM